MGSGYAFKVMLRAGRKSLTNFEQRVFSEMSPPQIDTSYGITQIQNRTELIKSPSNSTTHDSQTPVKRIRVFKESEEKEIKVNPMDLFFNKTQNSTFGEDMDYQYVQEIGPNNSGIWMRMRSKESERSNKEITVRKSKSFYKQTLGSEEQSKVVPKIVLEKYKKFIKKRKSMSNKFLTMGRSLQSSQTCDNISSPKENEDEEMIAGIEVIGTNKLNSEMKYARALKKKYLLKNHFLNEDGEGEPTIEEETLS